MLLTLILTPSFSSPILEENAVCVRNDTFTCTATASQLLNQKIEVNKSKAMFTLYRIVKRSVAESVPDRASVHTRNAGFEAVSAPQQYCSAPLLKVERSVSDRFLKRS